LSGFELVANIMTILCTLSKFGFNSDLLTFVFFGIYLIL